jgi:dTDP-4-dehydrorhamnose reductase
MGVMRILILGGTGLLGRALCAEAKRRGNEPLSAARSHADYALDLCEEDSLASVLGGARPDMVINAAALVELAACEADPVRADHINARPARVLARWSNETGRPFVHISTDHLFDGDGDAKHDEQAALVLCNAYARSKYAAEQHALGAPNALVVRTSIAGFHPDGRGFVQWALDSLQSRKSLTLFDDFYGSTIDTQCFSAALFDLIEQKQVGLINLASRDVSSKKEFILGLAEAAGITVDGVKTGSVSALVPRRARSLGLDVKLAEQNLGYALPGGAEVCANLVTQWRAQA